MSLGRAVLWSLIWVTASLCFAAFLSIWQGNSAAQLFLTGYVIEKSLSFDNLMVFSAIFAYFGIKAPQQTKILYWGIIGAAVLRFVFLLTGTAIISLHPAVGCTFAAIVLSLGAKTLFSIEDESQDDYEAKWFVRLARNFSTSPAFICLVAIEISDIIFSFDSMPAVIAVTRNPLIVYSSVMFAVLGLRSMYFVLAALMTYLSKLSYGVTAVLFFVGIKLMAASVADLVGYAPLRKLDIGAFPSLIIVLSCLAFGIIASMIWPEAQKAEA